MISNRTARPPATAAISAISSTAALPGVGEQTGRKRNSHDLELLCEARSDTCRPQTTLDVSVDDAALLPHEYVLEDDHVALHPLDLCDVGDFASAVLEPLLMNDQVDRGRDLLSYGAERQVYAGHQHHRLESGEHVSRGICVASRHRSVMAGVHSLEHVERLATTALADDDAIGAH